MKIEQQVVSLGLAKKLKELGVKQESYFSWLPGEIEWGYEGDWNVIVGASWNPQLFDHIPDWYQLRLVDCSFDDEDEEELEKKRLVKDEIYSAFTVAELDQWIGGTGWAVIAEPDGYHWVYKQTPESKLNYGMIGGHGMGPMQNPADRRADLLIYLLENGLMTV